MRSKFERLSKPEIDFLIDNCNFSTEEEILIKMANIGSGDVEIATKLNISISSVTKKKKKIEDEKAKENERIAKQNEINSKMINQKIEEFKKLEEKYNRLTLFFETKDKIDIDMKDVENQVTEYFLDRSLTWRESVQKAIDYTVKKFYNIAHRCQKGIAAFNNFLKGKTPTEIRNLAEDMEKNGSETFEEYEKKWMSKQLDWQIENGKNEKKSSIKMSDIER